MNVLFIASECAPFVKTGGLADVIGALPKALDSFDVKTKVLLPAYPAFDRLVSAGKVVLEIPALHGGPANLVSITAEGIDLLLLDAPHLYDRTGGLYIDESGRDWQDNHLRFGALCEVGAAIGQGKLKNWPVDLIHIHDWQAGLVPAYLQQSKAPAPPCVTTIHNIAFQGIFEPSSLKQLGLDESFFTLDGLEYFGKVSFLKSAVAYSEKITTVSPTYAQEILKSSFGMGFEGLLQSRKDDLTGILNGIDLEGWNPQTDPALAAPYAKKSMKGKSKNRAALFKRFGLKATKTAPLFCVISRLSSQKGLDLLLQAIPGLVERGAKLAVLGSGDKELEVGFLEAAQKYPDSVGVVLGYDEPLAHLFQGGSNAILIPSRFEPCGLTQLYAMRYGTLPIVARTGGLADTVIDANEAALTAACATGLQFAPDDANALDLAIAKTCALFKQPTVWEKMVQNSMAQENGWAGSAAKYIELYQELIERAKEPSSQ